MTASAAHAERTALQAVVDAQAQSAAAYKAAVRAAKADQRAKALAEKQAAALVKQKVKNAYTVMRELSARPDVVELRKVLARTDGEIVLGSVGPYRDHKDQILVFGGHGFKIYKTSWCRPPGPESFLHFTAAPLRTMGLFKRGTFAELDPATLRSQMANEVGKLTEVARTGNTPSEWQRSPLDWARSQGIRTSSFY